MTDMKALKKLTALLTAVVMAFSLTGCSSGSSYFNAAGSFVENTVSAVSEKAGTRMKTFFEKLSRGPEDGDWDAFAEYLFDFDNVSDTDQQTADTDENSVSSVSPVPENEDLHPDAGSSSGSSSGISADGQEGSGSGQDPVTSPVPDEQGENDADKTSAIESEYVPEYVHYDKEGFYALCDEFVRAASDKDSEKTEDLYDQLIQELKVIATMNTVAFLNYSTNVNNKYYDEENSYSELAYEDCYDRFMISCRKVIESKGGDAFEKHADASVVEEARDYEAMTDETKALLDRETQLESDYDKAIDSVGTLTYSLKGKTYEFEQLYEDVSPLTMLAMYNYNDFLKVYKGLLKAANESIGPIYLELLQVRKELAKEYGYENYADYCYDKVFGRKYSTEDAASFCDTIKENIGSRFYGSGASSYIYNSSGFRTEFSLDEIFDIVDSFTAGFDKEINDSFHVLLDKKLYDIDDGDGRYAGSYTSTIYTEGLPFIFINEEKTVAGLSTLEHEFGHFTNSLYEEKDPDNFYRDGNYDVMEIHSNSMQLLCSNHYGEILGHDEAVQAVQYEIAFQLYSVLDGCIYDEFQRDAYKNPDMTLDELNELYGDICREYGQTDAPGNEYMWVFITHTFESPMYYISYAVSALSALEIWQLSRNIGEDKAVGIWLDLMHEKDDEDYETVMKKAGLTPFTDTEAAVRILSDAMDDLLGDDLVILPMENAA